jgi:flagellar M-ring protein FliF
MIVALPIAMFWWLGRPDYQVLFSDLAPRDAAVVVASLEKEKTPYLLADDGTTVMVDRAALYKTRMKMLSGGLDLKGTVGFELFNNAEFGMTEFAQKINYQRALQGELARTIMGFDEVQNARVHLVLPEGGLLRKRGEKAKASVWVTLKGGKELGPAQVMGIQRLIAASVPDMEVGAVTVLDERGIALSARETADHGMPSSDASLQLKKETENYLVQKVARILNGALGPDQAAVGVNVVLDMSSVKTMRETILGGSKDTGVLVRKREQLTGHDEDKGLQAEGIFPGDRPPARAGSKTTEAEYQVGKETQQMVLGAGSIKHISIGIATRNSLSDSTVDRLKEVIGMTIGLNPSRGDGIAFSTMDNVVPVPAVASVPVSPAPVSTPIRQNPVYGCLAALLLLSVVAGFWRYRRVNTQTHSLSQKEREQVLEQVKSWLNEEQALAEEGRK